jgi:6-phosphofructokinase 1
MTTVRRIGLLTGGGDAPGLNAVIRAAVKAATRAGVDCVGIPDGFDGLLHPGQARLLAMRDVTGIQRLGGTMLGTTNRGSPLTRRGMPGVDPDEFAARCLENVRAMDLHAIIAIGGDGTLAIAQEFHRRGLAVIGVPKTIDSDLAGTSLTIGFDSAMSFATDAIDRLHTTGEAHQRVMVAEVMGRYVGWIALYSGMAGGADVVLIPEIPFQIEKVADHIRTRDTFGARCSIVVAAEGAIPLGGRPVVAVPAALGREERLGGIAQWVAAELERLTGREVRFDVLGHLQRGGAPTAADRVAAARFGAFAVELAIRGDVGVMVSMQGDRLVTVPLEHVVGSTNTVSVDNDLVRSAKRMGICFGD